MNIPFGYRFYLTAFFSYGLAVLWLIYHPDHDNLPYYIILGVYGYFLDGILKARIRRIRFIIYRVFYVLFLVTGAFDFYAPYTYYDGFEEIGKAITVPVLLALVPPFLMYWGAWIKELPFVRQFGGSRGGSARWAGVRTFKHRPANLKQGLFSFPKIAGEGVTTNRIFLGRSTFLHDPFSRLIGVAPIMHHILIAQTRAGKSVSSVYNILLTYDSDIIVIDPKGELASTTLCRRASKAFIEENTIQYVGDTHKNFEHGECFVLDPFGLTRFASNYYNPLSEIDIHADNAREMITIICDGCIHNDEKNRWASDGGKSLLGGLIAYAKSDLPPEYHNLSAISDLLYGLDEDGNARTKVWDELLIEFRSCRAAGGLPQQAAAELDRMGDRQKGAVLDTVSRGLKWASDPLIRKHMSRSDFSFSDIGTKTIIDEDGEAQKVVQTVYICIPDTRMIGAMMTWLRVLTGVSTVALQRRNPLPKKDTLLILDEFAKMKGLRSISEGFGLLAGYKIKLFIILQNISDIQNNYPSKWNTMVSNSTVQVFGLAPHDTKTPQWISNALGKTMKRRKEMRKGFIGLFWHKIVAENARELLTPTEVAERLTPNSTNQIILSSMNPPMLLDRLTFKPMRINNEYGSITFKTFGLDGLRGHIYDLFKSSKSNKQRFDDFFNFPRLKKYNKKLRKIGRKFRKRA